LVDDARAECDRLAAEGVEVSEIREQIPGTEVFDARDPDGNRFSFEPRRVLA
jgi:predicted enzyme related to lactoylglutathione lyase